MSTCETAVHSARARRFDVGRWQGVWLGVRQALMLVLCASLTAPALAFQMQGFDGSVQFLHDRTGEGRWTLVMIWSLDCIPCEQQKPMIADFHRAHASRAARVVGVATDGPVQRLALQAKLDHQALPYENLLAHPDVFARQYQEETGEAFRVTPTYLLYRPDGQLAGVHAGPIERDALEAVIQSGP